MGLPSLLKTSLNSASYASHLDAYTESLVWQYTTLLYNPHMLAQANS